MKRTLLQVGLWVLIAVFGYLCVMSIMRPINFNKVKKHRHDVVIQNLKDIRTAQNNLPDGLSDCILGYHAFTGCDTASAFPRQGKLKPLKLLKK